MTMDEFVDPVLATPVPLASVAEVEALAREAFGLEATAKEITGERDRNFRLDMADGSGWMLKVTNPGEAPEVGVFQNAALRHVEARDPGCPVPRVRLTRDGALQHIWHRGDEALVIRVQSWIPGTPLAHTEATEAQRSALGRNLARLDLALAGFSDPAQDHVILWDLQHAARLRSILHHIDAADARQLVTHALDRFEGELLPRLKGLRRQVIHNDLNPHNVLMRTDAPGDVAGIIDFGDMVAATIIQDVATACAYMGMEGGALRGPGAFVRGFNAVLPLQAEELALLPGLIMTRYVLAVGIGFWRASRYPENAPYILRNIQRSLDGVRQIAAIPEAEAVRSLTACCETAAP